MKANYRLPAEESNAKKEHSRLLPKIISDVKYKFILEATLENGNNLWKDTINEFPEAALEYINNPLESPVHELSEAPMQDVAKLPVDPINKSLVSPDNVGTFRISNKF